MLPGVYQAVKKDGTIYFRSNITYKTKHISLGSFPTEEEAHEAYREASRVTTDSRITITDLPSFPSLSFDKAVSLLNYRDNNLYFRNPIYLRKGYFSYYLSDDTELKFDIDDLFYYSSHRIQRRQGHLFVNDYGMQYSILSRYGIKPYAVLGRDYTFANGDCLDFRYSNIININKYYGVTAEIKNNHMQYNVSLHMNGNFKIGTYPTETQAAIAYNKAVDLAKAAGITRNFFENYIESCSPKEYATLYTELKISKKYTDYLSSLKKD